MRLAIIDATPIAGGPVSRALATSAAASRARHVSRLRVYDLVASMCAGCDSCLSSGRCTRHHPDMDEAVVRLASADALLVGAVGRVRSADPRSRALLERLVGAFGHLETARGLSLAGEHRAAHKVAALVIGTPWLLGVPAMLGLLPGVPRVWRVLDQAGTAVVGCSSVRTRWTGPGSRDRTAACAGRLGRLLSAASRRRPVSEQPAVMPGFAVTPAEPVVAIAS